MENQPNGQKYYGEELEIDLGDYVRIVWRRRKAVLAIFVTIIILATIYTFLMPKTYQSSALILPAKISDKIVEDPAAVIEILKQESVLIEIAQKFGYSEETVKTLASKFTVKEASGFLEVRATDPMPQKAKELVDMVSNFIINRENTIVAKFEPDLETEEGFLKDELDKNAANIANLDAQIAASSKVTSDGQGFIAASYIIARQTALIRRDELQKEYYNKQRELNFETQAAQIAVPSVLPVNPIKPNKKLNVLMAAVLGIFIGIGYVFVAESIEKTKKGASV